MNSLLQGQRNCITIGEKIMNEQAAHNKIHRLLMHAAVMLNTWIPAEKRTQYLNLFYSYIIEEEKETNNE